jgi:DNA-binding PadR family transcriptional regulator
VWGISPGGVYSYFEMLQEKGYATKVPNKHRSISVTQKGKDYIARKWVESERAMTTTENDRRDLRDKIIKALETAIACGVGVEFNHSQTIELLAYIMELQDESVS